MTHRRSIWLVARREVLERGRSRGFILGMFFTTALVVGSLVVPAILFRDDEVTQVGIVAPGPPGLDTALATAGTHLDRNVEIVPIPDSAAAESALRDGRVEVVVDVPADLSSSGTVRFHEEIDQATAQLISVTVITLRQSAIIAASDVDQAALAAAGAPPTVSAIDARTETDEAAFFVANIGAVLILIGIFSFGFTVLTGVVEEKQSRVVEVVLSTVRPRDLLMGKVLGIGVLGLVQLAVFVTAGVIAAIATSRVDLPATTPGAVALIAVWFVLGYLLYSTALGFLGALASRMEEASNATTPVTMVAMISYFVAIFAVTKDPHGLVAQVATYLPPSAPFVVPLRAAFDAISPLEVGLAVITTCIGIWVLFVVGARIYAGAVLQTTARMRIRDAWRSAGR